MRAKKKLGEPDLKSPSQRRGREKKRYDIKERDYQTPWPSAKLVLEKKNSRSSVRLRYRDPQQTRQKKDAMKERGGAPGRVFCLGHGVLSGPLMKGDKPYLNGRKIGSSIPVIQGGGKGGTLAVSLFPDRRKKDPTWKIDYLCRAARKKAFLYTLGKRRMLDSLQDVCTKNG